MMVPLDQHLNLALLSTPHRGLFAPKILKELIQNYVISKINRGLCEYILILGKYFSVLSRGASSSPSHTYLKM
jgi:hypothetical protein